MKKNIKTLAALLIASATFVACSDKDDIINENQQPVNPTGKYTMTINASKGGSATTRALSLDGKTLNVKWAATDEVSVFPEAWSATLTLTPMGALTAAASDDGSTTLTGTLTTLPAENDKLNLLFPRAEWDYTGQTGVLLSDDNSIEKKFDYATAQVTVATAEGGKITATGDADFTSQQAIVKFTLKDKANGNAISASSLKIAAAGGKLVQSRGMKPTYTYSPEGWEPVSGAGKYYVYVETNTTIQTQYSRLMCQQGQFAVDATYGTNGCKEINNKYLYRFVCETGNAPTSIDVNIYLADNNMIWGSIPFTSDMYLRQEGEEWNPSLGKVETSTVEGDPELASTYGPLTVTSAPATGELTVALRNELGDADLYSFEATDGEGNKYIFSRPNVNFENGKYYEIAMSMQKVTADKYVDLSTKTESYTAQDGDVLTGQMPSQYNVSIAANATVTLFNATISYSGWEDGNGITCLGDATIILKGDNSVTPNKQTADAICLAEGSTLTIEGNGKLTAKSGSRGVGIGNRIWNAQSPSNIIINGGTIIATGYYTGIGCGHNGEKFGNITINGGTVTAIGETGPGIGAGFGSSCGNITITNGVTSVTATKGSGADNSIGKGDYSSSCGTITIGGTEYPDGISTSPFIYPAPAPSYTMAADAASGDVGKLICTDGHIHAYGEDAECTATRVAKIIYVGNNTDNTTYTHGLALALADENQSNWSTAVSTCTAKNTFTPVAGASWMLPSRPQWEAMGATEGSSTKATLRDGFYSVGGTNMQENVYWSSTETADDTQYVYYYYFGVYDIYWLECNKNYSDGGIDTRACLVF